MKVTWVPEHTGFNTIFHSTHSCRFLFALLFFLNVATRKYLNDPYALHYIFIGQYGSKVHALLKHTGLSCVPKSYTGQAKQTKPPPVCVC